MNTEFESNYYIVEFEDGLQLIPNNWFTNGGKEAYWPNYKNFKMYDKAVEGMEDIKDDWKTHKVCKILGKSNCFERAKVKLKDAELYTDLSTDGEERRKNQRHNILKKKRLYLSSADDSDDELEKAILPFPKVPKNVQEGKSLSFTSTPKTVESGGFPTCLLEMNLNTPITTPRESRERNVETSPVTRQEKSSSKDTGETSSTNLILRTMTGLSFKLTAMAKTQADIMQKLDSIEQYIVDMPKEQQTKDNSIINNFQEIDNMRTLFPINDEEMMGMVESKLEDNTFKAQIVMEFSKIGGKDVKSIVYNLLPKLFTNSHAHSYSWYGAKGKKVFATLNLTTVIQEIVRCQIKEATNIEVEVPVKKWLSKAKERLERERKHNGS